MYIARRDNNIYMDNATTCALAHTKSRASTARRTLTAIWKPLAPRSFAPSVDVTTDNTLVFRDRNL